MEERCSVYELLNTFSFPKGNSFRQKLAHPRKLVWPTTVPAHVCTSTATKPPLSWSSFPGLLRLALEKRPFFSVFMVKLSCSFTLPNRPYFQHLVAQEDILRGRDEQKVRDAVFDIASVANQHVETVRLTSYDLK